MRRISLVGTLLFSFIGAAHAGLDILPKTGQTACYDSAGNFTDCPTTGLGQDGQLQKGIVWPAPRFVDNGNGTITDMLTGLMWLKDANCAYTIGHNPNGGTLTGNMSWLNALDFASKVNTGAVNIYACSSYAAGHSDWHVPTPRELESLFHYGTSTDNVNWLTSNGFVNVKNDNYWTSTTDTSSTGSQAKAVTIDVKFGYILQTKKTFSTTDPTYTWLVRRDTSVATPPAPVIATGQVLCYSVTNTVINCSGTGQDGETQQGQVWPSQRFVNVGDGTVMDNLTNLMWRKAFPTGNDNWQYALNYVIGMNNSSPGYDNYGYTDWRIPNTREALSLISWANYNKALPAGHPFTLTLGNATWTSSYAPDGKARAIMTDFYRGGQTTNSKSAGGSTYLPVRSLKFRSTVGNFKQSSGTYDTGQCVPYVRYETELLFSACNGDAYQCFSQAQAAGHYTGSTPRVGSIIVFAVDTSRGLPVGHVGIVTAVSGNNVTMQDANWVSPLQIGVHTEDVSQFNILGYIYP